ncbi:hypothetical protein B5X24_HaOG210435 [Helicoverpa armigera]|nr:hypothetical protein B5X24_HaOG210435 [Helicoverpa armigera]
MGPASPSRAVNPALATPLWSANEGKPKDRRPSLRQAGDGGQYTLPGALGYIAPRGRYSPSSTSDALWGLLDIIITGFERAAPLSRATYFGQIREKRRWLINDSLLNVKGATSANGPIMRSH